MRDFALNYQIECPSIGIHKDQISTQVPHCISSQVVDKYVINGA